MRSVERPPELARTTSDSGWRGAVRLARALPSAPVVASIGVSVPVPDTIAKLIVWSGMPLLNSSVSSAVSVALWLPPSHVGLLVRRSVAAGPGVMSIAFVTAGALPASSRATITIGSTNV